MIQEIRIENFKSVQKLKLPLGRFNVLIGENGCGKSNILEAIAMGAAAANDKLDNEFLGNRGIRVTEPNLMKSGFSKNTNEIVVDIHYEKENFSFNLDVDDSPYPIWVKEDNIDVNNLFEELIASIVSKEEFQQIVQEITKNHTDELQKEQIYAPLKEYILKTPEFKDSKAMKILNKTIIKFVDEFRHQARKEIFNTISLKDFLIFSPENSILRKFEDKDGFILGINGEGLFKLLTVIAQEKPEQFQKIKDCLKEMFDWFEDFEIPKDLVFTEKRLSLKDRYLPDIQQLSQRSANEGFLFVLFYVTLFVSDYTPSFFAIDNIDSALNPKLCRKLVTVLTRLSREHEKQVILTTHNPAVLDGLDLNDEAQDQRLMVVYRNLYGHTKINRVEKSKPVEGQEAVLLSEAFMRGYLGGLPQNF